MPGSAPPTPWRGWTGPRQPSDPSRYGSTFTTPRIASPSLITVSQSLVFAFCPSARKRFAHDGEFHQLFTVGLHVRAHIEDHRVTACDRGPSRRSLTSARHAPGVDPTSVRRPPHRPSGPPARHRLQASAHSPLRGRSGAPASSRRSEPAGFSSHPPERGQTRPRPAITRARQSTRGGRLV